MLTPLKCTRIFIKVKKIKKYLWRQPKLAVFKSGTFRWSLSHQLRYGEKETFWGGPPPALFEAWPVSLLLFPWPRQGHQRAGGENFQALAGGANLTE
jgi:hypothetical protein